jgi:predicted enzyme related to lactoylglutathione lyase
MIDAMAGALVFTSKKRFLEMRRFYVEVLGLTPRSDRSGFVNFELQEQRLTIAVHSDVVGENQDPLHVMLNLTTPDIATAYQAAIERGARSMRAPEREKWGGYVATLLDPDGNVIQLLELPIISAQSER